MSEKELIKKAPNCVDAYADAFGYSSFGDDLNRFGSISFFQHVSEWPADGSNNVEGVKYNIATLRMPEGMLLELARFIISQHENVKLKNSADE